MRSSPKDPILSSSESVEILPAAHSPEQNITQEAKRIGLEPILAYALRPSPESPHDRRKRQQRDYAEQKRAKAQAEGRRQLNIPDVPAELVDAVKQAVADVLSDRATSQPPSNSPAAPTTHPSARFLWLTVTTAWLFGMLAGWAAQYL